MDKDRGVENWIASTVGALEMSGALDPGDAPANYPPDPHTDHVISISEITLTAMGENEKTASSASATDSVKIKSIRVGRNDGISKPNAQVQLDQDISMGSLGDQIEKRVDDDEDLVRRTVCGSQQPSRMIKAKGLSGINPLVVDDLGKNGVDLSDGQNLSPSLIEATRQPLPDSPPQSEEPSRSSSLDIILACRDRSLDSPHSIPLPPSIISSVLEEQLGASSNVMTGNTETELRTSLEVLLSNQSCIEKTTVDATTVPLPPSAGERSEASSLRTLMKKSHGNPYLRTLPNTASPPSEPLETRLPHLYDYPGLVEHCRNKFPHLRNGNMHITGKKTRHNDIDISCYDYEKTELKFSSPGLSVNEKDAPVGLIHDVYKWSHDPLRTTTRLLVVQDLSPRTMSILGEVFGMHPEFFEEHLVNSGYRRAMYNEAPPSSWNSAGMKKHYSSVRWFRPVSRLKVPPFSRGSQIDLLKMPGARVNYPGGDSYLAETNIFRSEWPLSTDPLTSERRPIGWEERATLFGQQIGSCYFVILLLDPLPTLAQEAKDTKLVTRHIIQQNQDGGITFLAQQSRPARKRLTRVQRMTKKIAEYVLGKDRATKQSKGTRINQEIGISPPAASLPAVPSFYGTELERGEIISDQYSNLTYEDNPFTRVASKLIFEQSTPRVPLVSYDYDLSSLFRLDDTTRPNKSNVKIEVQDPNKTRSTREDFLEHLKEFRALNHPSFGNLACVEPLILLIIRDTSHLLSLIHRALDDIDRDVLNDSKMELYLTSWRQLLYRCGRELPDIEKSTLNFIGFCISTSQDQGLPPSEAKTAMEKLSKEVDLLLERVDKVSSSLISNMSLLENKRGIAEAESVTKLTELAFLFIPLSFASSIFGMQITNFTDRAPLSDFIALAILVMVFSYGLRLLIRSRQIGSFLEYVLSDIRSYSENKKRQPLRKGQPIPTGTIFLWVFYKAHDVPGIIWHFTKNMAIACAEIFWAGTGFLILFVGWMSLIAVGPLAIIWTRSIPSATKSVITALVLITILPFVLIPLWASSTPRFRAGLLIMIRQTWLALGFKDGQAIFVILSIGVEVGPLVALWKSDLAVGAKISITFAILIFPCSVIWFLLGVTDILRWLPEPAPLVEPKNIESEGSSGSSSLEDD